MVTNPLQKKNTNQQRIKIIDIHGWIFVIDASDRRRLEENQEILEDLLADEQLKDKPVLILANKQDQKNAVNKEQDLKRQLNIERLKFKHKIELCTSIPRKSKSKVDDSIRNGFSWLIRTIDENYTTLNARVNKATKGSSFNRKSYRSESDDNENINPSSRDKPTGAYRPKITSEKLPSINTKKTTSRFNSDDDDDIVTAKSDLNKKKKLIGAAGSNDNERLNKKVNGNEPKAFRTTFESFPEETPWSASTSSKLKPTKSQTTLPKLYSKPSSTYDTKRRDVSPLIHDAKPYSNGSTFKRDNHSDDDDDYSKQKSQLTTNRFAMNTTKPGYTTYGNEDLSRRIITGVKKTYNDDDDDENYLKKSPSTTLRKNYGLDEKSSYSRSSKPKYDDDDDEDNHRWSSSSKPGYSSKYDKDDYSSSRLNNRSRYDEEDRSYSSSKPISHAKFEDDDYPSANRSAYNGKSSSRFNDNDDYRPSSSSKPVTRSKYSDDDDDDVYSNSTRKNNYPSRSNHDDFFTTRPGSSTNTRFKSTSGYDS